MKNQNSRFLIVGNGNLAQHFSYYFQNLRIPYSTWNKSQNLTEELQTLKETNDYYLICITDSQILPFCNLHNLDFKKCIHFSGALEFDSILGFHPLMTFSKSLYTPSLYSSIPFIGTAHEKDFRTIFPFLNNPYHQISKEQKSYYHALCVISGNFTNILWQKAFQSFESLNIPKKNILPYLNQVFLNIQNSNHSLTGPLARRDIETLQKNLESLKNDPFHDLYKSFIKSFDETIYKEMNL